MVTSRPAAMATPLRAFTRGHSTHGLALGRRWDLTRDDQDAQSAALHFPSVTRHICMHRTQIVGCFSSPLNLIFLSSHRSADKAAAGRTLTDFKEGQVVSGRVRRVEKFGVFVELANSTVVSSTVCYSVGSTV